MEPSPSAASIFRREFSRRLLAVILERSNVTFSYFYTLTKNHAVNLSSNRMNVYLLPGTQEAMLELARRLNASIGAVRTSFLLDYLDLRGLL